MTTDPTLRPDLITKEDFKRAFDSAQPIAGDTSKLLDCIETIIKERDIANKRIRKLEESLQMFVDHYEKLPDDTLVGTGLTNEPFLKAKEALKND